MNSKNIKFALQLIIVIVLGITFGAILRYYIAHAPQDKPTTIIEPTPIQVSVEPIKEPETQELTSQEYIGEYTVFAYCPCVKCCGKTNKVTASGTIATEGRTVACNLPFGTKIYIEGIGERIVEDRGGGIKDGMIDLFYNTHEEALQHGIKRLKVWVVE